MQPIEAKFTNFKQFISDNAHGAVAFNPMLTVFMQLPLALFLAKVKEASSGLSQEEAFIKTKEALLTVGVSIDDYSAECVAKLAQYIEMFIEIATL